MALFYMRCIVSGGVVLVSKLYACVKAHRSLHSLKGLGFIYTNCIFAILAFKESSRLYIVILFVWYSKSGSVSLPQGSDIHYY